MIPEVKYTIWVIVDSGSRSHWISADSVKKIKLRENPTNVFLLSGVNSILDTIEWFISSATKLANHLRLFHYLLQVTFGISKTIIVKIVTYFAKCYIRMNGLCFSSRPFCRHVANWKAYRSIRKEGRIWFLKAPSVKCSSRKHSFSRMMVA